MLENVQHRATRLVPGFKNLSYTQRLQQLDLPSLCYRRFRGDGIEVYKYLHGVYRVDSSNILPLLETTGPLTRGHSLKLLKRSCNTHLISNFFSMRVVNIWNAMPETVIAAPTVNCFKGRFDKFWTHLKYETDDDMFTSSGNLVSHQWNCQHK